VIFSFEVDDEDLEHIQKNLRHGSFVLDRWSSQDTAKCDRLSKAGIIDMMSYHGENMCYNPSYRLTELGKKVFEQYQKQRESSAAQDV